MTTPDAALEAARAKFRALRCEHGLSRKVCHVCLRAEIAALRERIRLARRALHATIDTDTQPAAPIVVNVGESRIVRAPPAPPCRPPLPVRGKRHKRRTVR